jgi:DNA ligase-associated metallophosphoesterase
LKSEFALDIAGTHLVLLAAKALYWPQQQLLCVADAHFGKAAAYRALGQPVPHGTTANNLARLDALLAAYRCRQLVFLGDFLHARASRTAATMALLQAWRQRHPDLRCTLVRGNHDLRAGDPPPGLEMEIVDEPLLIGPLALRHIPAAHAGHHVIAGHEHPVFHLTGNGRQQLRLPCFHTTAHMTVLPSFGEFTGGHPVRVGTDSHIVVTDGIGVWSIRAAPSAE